jgi:hypothetical protein
MPILSLYFIAPGSRFRMQIQIHKAVLWIRMNPNILAGSESKPEKKFGLGFGSSHCWDQTLKREKNLSFSVEKLSFLSYRFQNTYDSNKRHHYKKKVWVKILV